MASHVDDTWRTMWMTHGKPCVTMHGKGMHVCDTWHAMCHYIKGVSKSVCGEGAARSSLWEQQGEGGGRKRGREEKRREREERKGEREEKGGKGKKKREEERGGREEKERGKRKECCAVSRPGRQRTRNCATRGRFSPTLVILHLGAM